MQRYHEDLHCLYFCSKIFLNEAWGKDNKIKEAFQVRKDNPEYQTEARVEQTNK